MQDMVVLGCWIRGIRAVSPASLSNTERRRPARRARGPAGCRARTRSDRVTAAGDTGECPQSAGAGALRRGVSLELHLESCGNSEIFPAPRVASTISASVCGRPMSCGCEKPREGVRRLQQAAEVHPDSAASIQPCLSGSTGSGDGERGAKTGLGRGRGFAAALSCARSPLRFLALRRRAAPRSS